MLNKICDIDGIDHWVISKLKSNLSKIFVAEFNPIFGSELEITVPDTGKFDRTNYHYSNLCFGVSLKALIKIMEKKNYYFLGTNLLKVNAFFVSNDFEKEKFFPKNHLERLSYYTNSNIRESRDVDNNLNYLSGKKRLKAIENCEVIDLSNDKFKLCKINDSI